MIKKLSGSFLLAFHNIRSHFFHTILSILGIVIGVAALVIILSLIDGLEKFAKEQIKSTSSLNAVMVYSETQRWVNNVRLKKDSIPVLTYESVASMKSEFKEPADYYLWNADAGEVRLAGDTTKVGSMVKGSNESLFPNEHAEAGRLFKKEDIDAREKLAVINTAFVTATKKKAAALIDRSLVFKSDTLKIIGVLLDTMNKTPNVYFPITRVKESDLQQMPPALAINAANVEDVNALKEQVTAWIKKSFPGKSDDFKIQTNEFRIKQAEQGFLLTRIIMGMIVGISVLVGGIGVMNVLLISVTQRTAEIGVRKAVGAKKRDIILQFLSEAITVSAFGSFLGLLVGIGFSMAAVPIVRIFVDVPFSAVYTWNTFILISVIAVLVGIIFGTYPAIRAAKLDPVEAIRRE